MPSGLAGKQGSGQRKTPTTSVSLLHKCAPGDITVFTALVRDIKLSHPHLQVGLHKDTRFKELFQNNPYVTPLQRLIHPTPVICDYGTGLDAQKLETIHFLPYFHRDFTRKTGLELKVHKPYPDIHLSVAEIAEKPVLGRYWVIVSGGKYDMTNKVWSLSSFQRTVDTLRHSFGLQFVQVGNVANAWQPPLKGTLDLRGQTSLRQLLQLIYHSEGVICGVTCLMHMAAALQKPCVVIAGGREAWWWEAYVRENRGLPGAESLTVPHRFLHTIGQLDCCQHFGCWRNKVKPLPWHNDAKHRNDRSLCYKPTVVNGYDQPLCMAMITPEHVVDAVMSYYTDNTLPPIGQLPSMPELVTEIQSKLVIDNKAEEPIRKAGSSLMMPYKPTTGDEDFDNSIIGGKMTFHVLLYGDYHELHKLCLSALLETVPVERMDLRIGSARLCEDSKRYVDRLVADGKVSWHYQRDDNPGKYVMMREMFWNEEHPIETNWLVWLDDDTMCNTDLLWFRSFCQLIIKQFPTGVRMIGPHYMHKITPSHARWIKQAKWYKGRPFRDKQGRPTPNGDVTHFATGSFWGLYTATMRAADIPDRRLVHNGGDFTIGEQLWQSGFKIASFSGQRQSVKWSSVPRRGRDDQFPWGGKDVNHKK